jgi:hypothetical protein
VAVLSRGAHGRSYLVEDATGKKLTLKELVFSKAADAHQVESFEREAAILGSLSHPGIPKLVRSFQEGSGAEQRLYIAHEYIAGDTLAHQLETRRFTEEEVVRIATRLLELLRYLHGLSPKVLHQDIKAANVIQTESGETYLVGFGSAREAHGPLLDQQPPASCLSHLAPEQLSGRSTEASDLYGVGMVMLQLLTRRSPEQLAASPGGLQAALAGMNVSPPTARIVRKLLAEDPKDRPRSAFEASGVLGDIAARKQWRRGRGSATPGGVRKWVGIAGLLALGAFVGRIVFPGDVYVVPPPAASSAPRVSTMRAWGPEQLLGPPNTPTAGDIRTAWASKTQDGRGEWVEVGFAQPVAARKVRIYETYNPGAIIQVTAQLEDGYAVLYQGGAQPPGVRFRIFEVSADPSRKIKSVRVELNSPAIPGWNEIDAIGLEDADGAMHWATSARASTTYAE